MSKHTPGPWDFSWHIQPNGCPTVGHKGLMVCMVAHSAKDQDQKETALANANLIAAAPDLFEALIRARDDLNNAAFLIREQLGDHHWLYGIEKGKKIADAAIALAKGESQ